MSKLNDGILDAIRAQFDGACIIMNKWLNKGYDIFLLEFSASYAECFLKRGKWMKGKRVHILTKNMRMTSDEDKTIIFCLSLVNMIT